MKIDFVIGSMTGGGAERVVSLLANYFAQNGHKVRVITFYGDDAYKYHPSVERVRFHKRFIINYATFRGFFSLIRFYFRKKNRPDCLSTHIGMVGYATIVPAKLYGIKSVISEHFNHVHQPKTLSIRFLWHVLFRLADAVTVLTKFDLAFFKKINGRTLVMENPCSFSLNENVHENKERKILAVGSLDRYIHKGFDNLLDIVSEVFKVCPDWRLQIIGGGEIGLNYLLDKTKKLGLEDKVEFSGFRNDVKEIMGKSSIFILPSRYEGLPMVLLEALSQKMACIAYDCVTGPSEIIEDGFNGFLVEDQNKDAMREKLIELIKSEKLREKFQSNAPEVLSRYSIEGVGKKWTKLFEDISK